MIEKPLTSADVEFVTTLHGEEPVSFVVLMQPRGDQDRLLRAIDDVALGELDEAVREAEEPEGGDAAAPREQALELSLKRAAGRRARRSGRSSRTIRWTSSSRSWSETARRRGHRPDRPPLRGGVLPPRLGLAGPAQGGGPGAEAVRAQASEGGALPASAGGVFRPVWAAVFRPGVRALSRGRTQAHNEQEKRRGGEG